VKSPGAGRLPSVLHWHNLYEGVFETNQQALPRRIHLARRVIKTRVEELLCTGENGETDALMEALDVLDELRKMDRVRRQELRRKAEL